MKFINQTKNTVYLSDIDRYIYFTDMTPQFISEHDILKSKGFQKLVSLNKFLIIEAGSSRIEQNLLRIQSENSTTDIVDNAADTSETDIPCHTGLEIVLKGHFLEAGGYAKVNRNLALGLLEKGVDVKVDIVGSSKVDVSENEIRDILQLRKKPSRNALHLDSIIPTYGATGTGRRKIIYTTVESSTIPKQFVESVNMYDDIWVTSNFCSDVLKRHGVSKDIFVLPDSINTDLYTPIGPKCEFKPSLKEFVFISVFGWSYRKGYDLLLKSFLKAFNGNDNVSLLIFSRFQGKTSNSNVIQKEVSKYIDEYGGDNPAHIIRCSRIIAESDMPSLYRACNAFVLFSRGEGFGLPYCFKKDTLVQTPGGMKKIQDIKIGDKVNSGYGKIKEVLETHRNRYLGKFKSIKTMLTYRDIEVTSNHKFLAYSPKRNYKGHIKSQRDKINEWIPHWIEAGELTKDHLLVYPIRKEWNNKNTIIDLKDIVNKDNTCFSDNLVWNRFSNKPNGNLTASSISKSIGCSKRQVYHYRHDGKVSKNIAEKIKIYTENIKEKDKIEINRYIEVNERFSKLMGYYLAEGSIGSSGNLVEFSFHAEEGDYHREVIDILKDYNLLAVKSIYDNKCRITVSSRIFAEICLYFCGKNAGEKIINEDLMNSPKNVIKSLLNGYINGDGGSYSYTNSVHFSTSSSVLAMQIQKLLLDMGERCSLNMRKGTNEIRGSICGYNSRVEKWIEKSKVRKISKETGFIYSNDEYTFIPISSIKEYEDDCIVYNFDVKDDHCYIANISVAHNCEASLCGLPVIGTNCSGQTMFLNKSNSSLVDIDFMTKMQSGQMHVHYWDNQEFPSFTSDKSVNDSADILRDVYKNYKVSLKKNKILEKYLRTNYSINNISNMAYNRILHGEKR